MKILKFLNYELAEKYQSEPKWLQMIIRTWGIIMGIIWTLAFFFALGIVLYISYAAISAIFF